VSDGRRPTARLRRMVLGAIVLVLGSGHSIGWAIAHGASALAIHASLGLALIVLGIAIPVRTLKIASRSAGGWTILAAALIIGAGFNGASFLDFGDDINSLIMAVLALAALGCYAIALFLLPATP
jgi:hypothetical protein